MEPSADNEQPFVAPCKTLDFRAPLRWLALGWNDLKRAPRQSIGYGLIMVMVSYLISFLTWRFGNLGLYLGLVSGFVFMGPWLALTLYAISIRLERQEVVSLRASLQDARRQIGAAMVFAVILTVVFGREQRQLFMCFFRKAVSDHR